MKNSSRAFWLLILASLLFHRSLSKATDKALEKVTLQLQWKHQFEFAGFYAAKEKGFYQEAGLEVEFVELKNGLDVSEVVLNNTATFGTSDATVILDRMKGKPAKIIANYFKRSPLALVVKQGIYSPNDLRGKRIMGRHVLVDAMF